jgi:hypothetical protein
MCGVAGGRPCGVLNGKQLSPSRHAEAGAGIPRWRVRGTCPWSPVDAWREPPAAVTVVQGRPATVQIGDGAPFSIEILESKTVSARDLKQQGSHTGEAGDSSSG